MVLAGGLGRLAAFRSGWDTPTRDAPRGPVVNPPEPVRVPAVAGRLATRRGTGSLGAATLLDLAERGVVRCSETTGGVRWLGRSFTLQLALEPLGLLAHERAVLDLVFGPAPRRAEATMANVQRVLASHAGRLGRALHDDMRWMRLVDGDRVAARRCLVIAGLLLLGGTILSVGAAIMLMGEFGAWPIALPLSVAIVALACAGVAANFSILTPQGAREAAAWRAFAAHMKQASERDAGRTTVVPRRWLPLGVAMGVGPAWAKRMIEADGTRALPAWFEPADSTGASSDAFLAFIDACSAKTGTHHGTPKGTNETLAAAIAEG